MKLIGKVVFQNIGTGIWGVIDREGDQWEVLNLPDDMKKEGLDVTLKVTEDDCFSIFMWGTPVRIV